MNFPTRYLPKTLVSRDKQRQYNMLVKSKTQYAKHKYYTRKRLPSFKSKTSKHILRARSIYNVKHIGPTRDLARKTGCKRSALRAIIRKGEGAYYSSGSRPNQTPQSWGVARLASAITAGKAAKVDYDIIKNGCDHKKKAFIMAQQLS
jgi:hypothetical protein